jgi:hypothetical protein
MGVPRGDCLDIQQFMNYVYLTMDGWEKDLSSVSDVVPDRILSERE